MIHFLLGIIAGIILGAVLTGFILKHFDVINTEYNIEGLKAKKGGKIDIRQAIEDSKPKTKRKFFNFKNRRQSS